MQEIVTLRVRWGMLAIFIALSVSTWSLINADRGVDAMVTPASLVINEIHYSPAIGGVEFIELLSVDQEVIDLSGYEVPGFITLPDGTLIEPGELVVITADLSVFEGLNPGVPALEWNAGVSLDDSGERLVLTSPLGELVDEVAYGDGVIDPPEPVDGTYTIDQVIDGTIGAGDSANPNEEDPMGLHDAPLYLPQGWSWAQGPSRNVQWGAFGTGSSLYAEWRCAVIPEFGHNPSVPFRVNVRNAAYWQFANDAWSKGFDVNLTGGHRGSYLGNAGQLNADPYSNGRGQIAWRLEADGSFSAPWNQAALMMHFWASQRLPAIPGQTAELSTAEFRLQQPDGQTVDLSLVRVLFQCGVDYYSVTGGQGTKVPGPGIGKYHTATPQWTPSLWTTLPSEAPAASTAEFQTWLAAHLPPVVAELDQDAGAPWPAEPAGTGPSLELIEATFDNSLATSWVGSDSEGGTPGIQNSFMCNGLVVTVHIATGGLPTSGPDVILGTSGPDLINALGGDDIICGLGGDDTINGGGGIDTVFGGDGDDTIGGQGEADILHGEGDNDRINGGIGDDLLFGGPGVDDLRGQGDNDTMNGGEGVDQFFGGSGNDTINTGDGGNRGTAMVVRGGGNNDIITGSPQDDDLEGGSGLDDLFGEAGDDRLRGGNASDELFGGSGADTLEGGAQRDFLYGGDDDDTLSGGTGNDDLFGDSGDDSMNGQGGVDLCDGGIQTVADAATATCENPVDIP